VANGGYPLACDPVSASEPLWRLRSSHCRAKPLVQQFAKVQDFFTIRGNNSALLGV